MPEIVESTPKQSDQKSGCFAFGKNWKSYSRLIDEHRIAIATEELRRLLQKDDLRQKRFLDVGCGSGLASLAATRLGAIVTAFDADRDSVECSLETRSRFPGEAAAWSVQQGSLLDNAFLNSLGKFDIVYCWGVAHHTGSMWHALTNLSFLVDSGGLLVVAIYNDEGFHSRVWSSIKCLHHRLPSFLKTPLVVAVGITLWIQRFALTLIASMLRIVTLRNPSIPFRNWWHASRGRGMDRWHDLVDWVGGWPFEVAKPDEIFSFYHQRAFELQNLTTVNGHGCNEYVFLKR